MDADRWQRLTRLYHEALERPVDERRAFLEAACSSDEALRGEVNSLLQNSETLHGGLGPGVTLGSYQIDRPLGRGGMGVVFLAHDTILHRQVALKAWRREAMAKRPMPNCCARPATLPR